MVAFKNSTGIKANSSFCTFRFPIVEAHQLTKPFQYQAITTALPTQPFAHFVFMPILCLFHSDASLFAMQHDRQDLQALRFLSSYNHNRHLYTQT